jgi:hypothetical protein
VLVVGLLCVPVLAVRPPTAEGAPAAIACTGATYTVKSGDSWSRIASQHGVTMAALLAANNATTATVIHPGQIVCLPVGATNTTTTAAPTTTPTTPKLPAGAISIAQFPVQGLCWFIDSYGAPRSGGRAHEGVDVLADEGNKVYAVDDGVLTKQYIDAPGSLSGNGWRLTRADGTYFFYAHLSAFAPGLSVGSKVAAGQIIGLVGMTGNAGTPHVHFEVHPGGGAPINPTPTITAVNGCKNTKIPPQPGETPPTSTPTPATSAPTSAAPTSTAAPATTAAPTTSAPPPDVGPGLWQFITPAAAFDGLLPAGTPTKVVVGRLPGVAPGTTGVMVRVLVRNAAVGGYLAAYTCAAGPPGTSTLNYAAGRVNATMSLVGVSDGSICVSSTASIDVRIEVVGIVSTLGVGVVPTTSRRALDTRTAGAPLLAKTPVTIDPTALGTPRGAKAVTVTVTLLAPAAAGNISLGPCGGIPWTVGYTTASAQVFSAIVRTNDTGLCVSTTTATHLVLDVTGVWAGTLPLGITGPTRVYDSRSTGAITTAERRITLPLPAGAKRAQLTIAVLGGSAGALFAWNCASPRPTASVASTLGMPVAVTATMDVTGGQLCVASTGSLHAIVDLTGMG